MYICSALLDWYTIELFVGILLRYHLHPFTELSGKNLENVAQYIHTFANQIILMADDKSYGGVAGFVEPEVCSKTKLLKNEKEGITYIK